MKLGSITTEQEAKDYLASNSKIEPVFLMELIQQLDEPETIFTGFITIAGHIGRSVYYCSSQELHTLIAVMQEAILHAKHPDIIWFLGSMMVLLKSHVDVREAGALAIAYEFFPDSKNEDLID